MSPGHSGFIDEYPLIRVDKFTGTLPALPQWITDSAKEDLPAHSTHFVNPHIQLLSHAHTDHLIGLSSLTQFSAPIYCSEVTKRLLLSLERKEDRILYDQGKLSTRKRPYKHLRRTEQDCKILNAQSGTQALTPWDLLSPLPFDTPVLIDYNANVQIRLTLLPANHMPGSTMFLIEGPRGSILHTGDLRAEQHFIEDLMAKTHLGRLSALPSPILTSPEIQLKNTASSNFSASQKLETLYLDTERILDDEEPLVRSKAINNVLQLIKLYPATQKFHINLWTSGYEHFLIGLHKLFVGEEESKIHVDRYMFELFEIMAQDACNDYIKLPGMVSQDKRLCGRFCACNWQECQNGEGIVHITPYESMGISSWREKRAELFNQIKLARKGKAAYPDTLPLPIQRHSPLPELYRMINLLKPTNIVANTATPTARFIAARLSEQVGIQGAVQAENRQKESNRTFGLAEEEKRWEEMVQAWKRAGEINSSVSSTHLDKDGIEEFLHHVKGFRTILFGFRKMESERLLLERLDAASDALLNDPSPSTSLSVFQSSSIHFNVQALSTPSALHKSTAVQIWEKPGKYAAVNASPFMTAAMREEGCSTIGSTSNMSNQTTHPILTTELASRYLAYAAMYLGWKIRNPSRYRQEVAWRAVRKIKPKLARDTEEALLKELSWPIPPWDETNSAEVSIQTSLNENNAENQSPKLPSTPRPNASKKFPQSISPLELDENAKVLKIQLDREAESQQSLFSEEEICIADRQDGQSSQVREAEETLQLERLRTPPCAQRIVRQSTRQNISLSQLRETVQSLRIGRQSESAKLLYGKLYFDTIVDEWKSLLDNLSKGCVSAPMLDKERVRCQLDLIGVASRSQRARKLLGWEGINFNNAYTVLREMYKKDNEMPLSESSTLTRMPCIKRAQIVIRFLERFPLYNSTY